MSEQLATCLMSVVANLAGMLVIYSIMTQALARLAWRDRGISAAVLLIIVGQLFWIVPVLAIAAPRGREDIVSSAALWFGNWLVGGFSVVIFWKSATRIPTALDDAAQLDGLGGFGSWRCTVFPFVRRDLALIAIFTIMATLVPFWVFNALAEMNNVVTVFERTSGWGAHIGRMVAESLIGALPLLAIFFAAKKSV